MRLGWLIAPAPVVDHLALVKQRCDLFTPGLTQLVVAAMVNNGDDQTHLARLRAEHARRHDAMIAALERRLPPEALSWRRVAGGLYLWARLGCGFDADDVAQAALADGVALVAGNAFYPDGDGRCDIRLCFARTPPDRIDAGIARLAHALRRIRDTQRPASGRCPLV